MIVSGIIVLPIPPGTHWSDAKPLIFPEVPGTESAAWPAPNATPSRVSRAKKEKPSAVIAPPPTVRRNGLMFDIPQPGEPLPEIKPANAKPPQAERVKAEKVKRMCDPRLVSAARELRDRWREQVNATPLIGCGKYDVSRTIDASMRIEVMDRLALPSPMAA